MNFKKFYINGNNFTFSFRFSFEELWNTFMYKLTKLTSRKKMNYQITYEDALRICEAYKNFNFYKTEYMFDNYKVVTFNYFLCEYKWFVKPLEKEPNIHARDMRGVTFVFNEDGTLYKRFLMLEKFFNLNQVEETQYDLVKDKKIKYITVKEDGSLIAFMQLPNGKVFAKTQGGFDNEQSIAAMNIYNNDEKLRNFIDKTLLLNFTPLFEYVAFDNRIVLKYSGRELRLIVVRNNIGKFIAGFKYTNSVNTVKSEPIVSIDILIEKTKTEENIEGWVIEFTDGQMIKIKSEWYCNLHGIRTVSIFREDYIISNYLNETLDDAITDLNQDDDADAFEFIEVVKSAIMNWSNHIDKNVDELHVLYNTIYEKNWVKFATEKYKSAFFGLARTKIEKPEFYISRKIEYMLSKTNHLNKAKSIVETFKT